jgi:RimJ/RimL family protein N-acetyltransferase
MFAYPMTSGEQAYLAMPRLRLQDRDLSLRAVQPADIESIRQWRNAQMDVLRQTNVISAEAQKRYFAEYVWPQKDKSHPKQILLAIERNGELIGYGGLVHISWLDLRAEVSFLLAPTIEIHHHLRSEIFTDTLRLLQEFAFLDLSLSRLWTETYSNRIRHIHTLESVGFQLEGRLRNHVVMGNIFLDSLIHGSLSSNWRK